MASRQNGRLYERVAGDIAARIRAGEPGVGQRLPAERVLAIEYAVSRPVIREAIIALEVDGLVQVKVGSGVYVTASTPVSGVAADLDFGPFELLETRRAIEPEACALAALRISDDDIGLLETLVEEMRAQNPRDPALSENADRGFHEAIARATENSAMEAVVLMLWEARSRSPQYRFFEEKAHAAGILPRVDEHMMIVEALRRRDPEAARTAMRHHLTRVLESLLEATEVHEVEQARAKVAEHRRRWLTAS
jgi:DNA-binding FadR family transcriptional regulator